MSSVARVPLHAQVAAALRSEIKDHRLPPGSPMPSEAALQARFGVARSVVRQALSTLVSEGLVVRGQGRGTVVAPPREHHRLVQRSSGLFTQMAAEGAAVETSIVVLRDEPAPEEAAWLSSQYVVRLERLRSVDGEPLAYIRTYLPLPACEGLTVDQLTNASLHATLQDRLGLRPTGGRRQIRAVAADRELATMLQVGTGSPLLLLEGQGTDQHGRPLEVFATWHRADRIAFDIDVNEQASTSALSGAVAVPTRESGRIDRSAVHGAAAEPTKGDRSELQEAAQLARQLASRLERLAEE